MALIQVVAVKRGYLKSKASLINVGDILQVDDAKIAKDKDGKPLLNPDGTLRKQKWLKLAPNAHQARQEAAAAVKAAEQKGRDAALAASGGKVAKQKVDTASELAG